MKVVNIHERLLAASVDEVGALIDRLASDEDLLWPVDRWPPMRFDRPYRMRCFLPVKYSVHPPSGMKKQA